MSRKYTDSERIKAFWSKVDKSGDCWEWTGAKYPKGYGRFKNGKRLVQAHKFAYEQEVGPTGNLQVCHHCDNPGCVNPAHLFLGTQKENMRDCVNKGRCIRANGENHGNCKLTDAEVAEIRAKYKIWNYSQRELGTEYGVSRRHICDLIRGKRRAQATAA